MKSIIMKRNILIVLALSLSFGLFAQKDKKPNIILLGDSHARHLRHLIDKQGLAQGWSADVLASSACIVLKNLARPIGHGNVLLWTPACPKQ